MQKRALIQDGRVFCTRCGVLSAAVGDEDEVRRVFGFRRMTPEAVTQVRQPQCRACRALASKASAAKKKKKKKKKMKRNDQDDEAMSAAPTVAVSYHDVVLEALTTLSGDATSAAKCEAADPQAALHPPGLRGR